MKIYSIGLVGLTAILLSACGNKVDSDIVSTIESEALSSSLMGETEPIKETYIDDSGKQIEKVGDNEGPQALTNKLAYESVAQVLQDNIEAENIISDETIAESKERNTEEPEETKDIKLEKYDFNADSITLDSEIIEYAIAYFDSMTNSRVLKNAVRFGDVSFGIDTSIEEVGYNVETSGNKGTIKINNGKQITVIQLHKGNVGINKFSSNMQVSTIQKYLGCDLSNAEIADGVIIDSEIEKLNTYIYNNRESAVCIYKTIDGIYLINWGGTEFGDAEQLMGLIELIS